MLLQFHLSEMSALKKQKKQKKKNRKEKKIHEQKISDIGLLLGHTAEWQYIEMLQEGTWYTSCFYRVIQDVVSTTY